MACSNHTDSCAVLVTFGEYHVKRQSWSSSACNLVVVLMFPLCCWRRFLFVCRQNTWNKNKKRFKTFKNSFSVFRGQNKRVDSVKDLLNKSVNIIALQYFLNLFPVWRFIYCFGTRTIHHRNRTKTMLKQQIKSWVLTELVAHPNLREARR